MAVNDLIAASRRLARDAGRLRFAPPVAYVYNPLVYAREPAELYVSRYARGRKQLLFVGMNPGPWGMAQTGVPFGEVTTVRGWLGIEGRVSTPPSMHPRVPVRGFACGRSEVSGSRLWGLIRERFGEPRAFARLCFVANYCPLLFLDEAGRNLTPDRLSRADREALFPLCDRALAAVVQSLQPQWLVGVGAFAHGRLRAIADAFPRCRILAIPHPSPASPQANKGWAREVRALLEAEGAWMVEQGLPRVDERAPGPRRER